MHYVRSGGNKIHAIDTVVNMESITYIVKLSRGNDAALRILEYIAWDASLTDARATFSFLTDNNIHGGRLARMLSIVRCARDAAELADTLRRHPDIRRPLRDPNLKIKGTPIGVLEHVIS